MFEKNQILYMRFQCIDMYGCPKLLDMNPMCQSPPNADNLRTAENYNGESTESAGQVNDEQRSV